MFSLFQRNARQAKPARRTPLSSRPRLEVLEDRLLLNTGALDSTFGHGALRLRRGDGDNDSRLYALPVPELLDVDCGPEEGTAEGANETPQVSAQQAGVEAQLVCARATQGGTLCVLS
jgi:hypothetical protein